MNEHRMLRIENIVDEAKGIKTFVFNHNLNAKPGQFILAWIPRIGEKPFGVAYQTKDKFAITVSAVGDFTNKLHKMKIGDFVGIRGPFGNGFKIEGKRIALVAGGYGIAPLAFLADEALNQKIKIHFIIGAKTKDLLLYQRRFENTKATLHIATDDGSCGEKGFTTDLLGKLLKKKRIDKIYSCGPEIMMKFVLKLAEANNIPLELSLERYMKCAVGICGQCCLDSTGWRVCKEGPVFSKEQIKQITEFSNYKRAKSGKKVMETSVSSTSKNLKIFDR